MALDVGDRRIGVALSDPLGVLATPLTTIQVRDDDSSIAEVLRLARENDVSEIVVGLPLSLSGRMGQQAKRAAYIARLLSERAEIPVRTVDERHSSAEAERLLRQSGIRPSENKARIDSAAAAIILQSYLDTRRTRSS
ncbi:MAG: Holliday junction resolvase RuvX [Chloroflexi bacterium]|nr:Holliday junction resolvase RuvX [Chloroflexota bacterium]